MKGYGRLRRLPLGAVRAAGWMKEQLRRSVDGIGGHLDELEPGMIGTPYTTRASYEGWGKERRAGWGAEISGNYWWGLIELAYTSGDAAMIEKAGRWADAVLRGQRADGYLGTYTEEDDFFDDYNAWGTSCGMNALLAFYDATGRADVLDAVYRCMLWFCENWKGDRKTRYAGITITECMTRCYLETGDERLLDLCRDYERFLEENDLFDGSLRALLSPALHYNSTHGALHGNRIGQPALMYACTGEETYLRASVNAYRKAKEKVVLPNGGISCESEYLAPVGPTVETEYCAFTMYHKSLAALSETTGDAAFADDMEQLVFNGAQGARKKDERAVAYLSSPNQVMATESSSYADSSHQVYAPCVPTACCAVNSVRILPEFVRSIALEGEDGLYFSVYAPSVTRYRGMTVSLDTDYPFRETLTFRFEAEQAAVPPLSCRFRIPGWCGGAWASLNGERIDLSGRSGYVSLGRDFVPGDVLVLTFPMKPRITAMDDRDRLRMRPLSVFRGPLLYALPIPEIWSGYPGHPATPLPEGWRWYAVTPVIPPSGLDVYDDMGMRRRLISWNAALSEAVMPEDISVLDDGGGEYPWEHPPVTLSVKGFRAPYSYPPYPQKTLDPYVEDGYAVPAEEMELRLVPYGCTALRISCFPRVRAGAAPV